MLAGNGLSGQYFHNPDFTGLAAQRSEAIDFNWGSSSPVAGLDSNTFSVRWQGQVEALHSEEYTFYTTSNQGVRLWVDGQLLIDNWEPHNTEEDAAAITLTAGQKYDLRLDYFEQFGGAEIQLEWSSPSQTRQIIPATQLYSSPVGLLGTYEDRFGGNAVRVDPVIDFNWGIGRPHPEVAVDQFEVAWTGQLRADFSEQYEFSITSDQGARLWIGEELVIDDWTSSATHTATGSKTLEAGKWYDLRIEYFDEAGSAEVDLKWSSERQTGADQFAIVPSTNLRASKATQLQFTNPLGPGADPFVQQWDGQYYHVSTTGNNVRMERAENLQNIHISDPKSSSMVVWTPPGGTFYSEQIWAPELHRLNDKWYIYVAASNGNNATHRMHVLERDDPNPMGSYVYKGQVNTGDFGNGVGNWAIDGTVLNWQDEEYFIWSGWPAPGTTDNPELTQNLYISEMSNPWTLTGPQVLLSSADLPWERAAGPEGHLINEGPQILIKDDHLHILYSANGFWMREYSLGRLTYDGEGSLLDAASWQEAPHPVFQQGNDVVGTGHASFTTSLDGTEHWIVFHAHANSNRFRDDRVIHIQPFEFNQDGIPELGSPLPVDTPLPVPSGKIQPERPFVPGDFDANGEVEGDDLGVWKAQYGAELFPGTSADTSGNGKVDGGDFLAWQRNFASTPVSDPTVAYWRHEEGTSGSEIAAGANSVLDSSENANHMMTLNPSLTSATYSSSVTPVALKSGDSNALALDFGPGGDDFRLNDDNFTNNKPIDSQLFEGLTVEFAFQMNSIGGFQTLVGKDGKPTSSPVAPLQIKVRGDDFPAGIDNQLFVEWIDGDLHALASGAPVTTGNWNHVAFVLSENTAEFYTAGESGDYVLRDSILGADFAGASGEVLIDSTGSFTVGRGMFNGNVTDYSDALIDEVRISDRPLEVSEFLFDTTSAATEIWIATSEAAQYSLSSTLAVSSIGSSVQMPLQPDTYDAVLSTGGESPRQRFAGPHEIADAAFEAISESLPTSGREHYHPTYRLGFESVDSEPESVIDEQVDQEWL